MGPVWVEFDNRYFVCLFLLLFCVVFVCFFVCLLLVCLVFALCYLLETLLLQGPPLYRSCYTSIPSLSSLFLFLYFATRPLPSTLPTLADRKHTKRKTHFSLTLAHTTHCSRIQGMGLVNEDGTRVKDKGICKYISFMNINNNKFVYILLMCLNYLSYACI